MKILLTGSKGFVGSSILRGLGNQIIPSPSLRGMTEEDVKRMVEESGADAILHTAAISQIPECERDPEASYVANVLLPTYLAKAAGGRKFIAFSSDQVYSGSKETGPFSEEDVNPGNVYARHKLEMENRVLEIDPGAVLLRAEWMYDYGYERSNYINILASAEGPLSFSSTQYRGVTYIKEVVESVPALLTLPGGAYNYGSETTEDMFRITQEALRYMGREVEVLDQDNERGNLWMKTAKAQKGGVHFSSVLDGVKRCIDDYNLKK